MPADPLQIQIDALNKRLDDIDRHTLERLESVKENVASALASADKAVTKAEIASEKRFESVNEFRAALSDQAGTFIRSSEYNTTHQSLLSKVDILSNQVIAIDTTLRNKVSTAISGPSFFISVAGVMVLLIVSIITGAVQLGNVQNQVASDKAQVEHLIDRERIQDSEALSKSIIIENIKTRQQTNEGRLDRVEKRLDK